MDGVAARRRWCALGAALSSGQFDSDAEDGAAIVGMWHVTFTAKTINGASIPDTVIDNALVVWHSDKTEIMNSGRPPQDGDFCMGVWEYTRNSNKYKLNHFAWGGNAFPTDPPTEIGPPAASGNISTRLHRCGHGDTHHHGHEGRRSALREAGPALVRAAGVRPAGAPHLVNSFVDAGSIIIEAKVRLQLRNNE